jgi:hypothetical protein
LIKGDLQFCIHVFTRAASHVLRPPKTICGRLFSDDFVEGLKLADPSFAQAVFSVFTRIAPSRSNKIVELFLIPPGGVAQSTWHTRQCHPELSGVVRWTSSQALSIPWASLSETAR